MSSNNLLFFCTLVFSLFISACTEEENESIITESPVETNVWTDSIFGVLSEKEQYYQHLIIKIPASYQNKIDTLTNWLIDNQPGAVSFDNWSIDSVEIVKNTLDTVNMIHPLIYCDFFKTLNLSPYPYWEANDKNCSAEIASVFSKSAMNLINLSDLDCNYSERTIKWTDSVLLNENIFPITKSFSDHNIKDQLAVFFNQLQRSDNPIHLKIEQLDTIHFEGYRNAYNYQGLFIVSTSSNQMNILLNQGADFVFHPIEEGDYYNKWKESTEAFQTSTKRILNLKSELNPPEKFNINKGLKYVRLNLLHNSVALLSNKSNIIPSRKRITLYSNDPLKVRLDVRREMSISTRQSTLDLAALTSITNNSGNKAIILPDTSSQEILNYVNKLKKKQNTLICFTNADHYESIKNTPNLIYVPLEAKTSANIFAQQLTEAIDLGGDFIYRGGMIEGTKIKNSRMAITAPEFVGFDSDSLSRINWIVKNAINGRAFPGCQVLLAKKGCVIYNRQFGHHSYERQKKVTKESIYDLASLTKVVATTLVGMKLWEMGKYKLKDSLYMYLPDSLDEYLDYPSTIRNITFHELFIHKSGLPAGFPLIRYLDYKTEDIGQYDRYFCDVSDTAYCIEVAENFYFEKEYADSMWLKLNQMWLDKEKPYKYSDVNMNTLYYMFKGIIQNNPKEFGFTESKKKLSKLNLFEEFLYRSFYHPLKMERTSYKPLRQFDKNSIAPTENESFWRMQLLQGYVHDPNAALMGGVAGNAGVFSTTNDLVRLCQMLLNKGIYDHKRYLKAETVTKFTSVAEDSHRGLGFNKRTISTTGYGMADSCSLQTYGHTGFTGTCFWIDPEEELIYIFLSNRVHPKVNNRIYQYSVRKKIHNAAFSSRMLD